MKFSIAPMSATLDLATNRTFDAATGKTLAPPNTNDFARLNPGNYYRPCLTSDGVEP